MTVCPPAETLEALITGALPPGESAAAREHLLACASCRAWLDGATDDEELKGWVDAADRPSPFGGEAGLARLLGSIAAPSSEPPLGPREAPADPLSMLAPPLREGDLGALGPYRIEAELGRGGMAIVYRGYDDALNRPVAVKVPRPEFVEGDRGRRLTREARIAARFRHENAVGVYAVAVTPRGLPFIVMEYVAGSSLARLIRSHTRLEPREAAEIAAQVADGLAAAHEAGLIHRDVKPSNILLDPDSGRARIVDFGMARAVDLPGETTLEGTLGGTPAYMSPEQVVGDVGVDGRADLYGLGATLYEAIVGEPPFLGTPVMVLHQILNDEPRPPRRLNEAVPRDLETICLKALEKEPRRRYADARALADDLRRWLRGEPVAARPPGPAERLGRWARRNAKVAGLAATVAALLVLLAGGATVAAFRIDAARQAAVAAGLRADRNASEARSAERRAAERARVANDQRALALDTVAALVGQIQEELGGSPNTLELRRKLSETALRRLGKIARAEGGDDDIALSRIVAYDRMGDISLLLGRTGDARKHHESARGQAEALIARPGASKGVGVEANRHLARALDKLGDLASLAADFRSATTLYTRARTIREALPTAYREGLVGRRELAVSAQKIGDLERGAGDAEAALREYTRGLELIEATSGLDEDQHLADLRFSHSRLGEAQLQLYEVDAALGSFQKALQYARALARRNPNDPKARRAVDSVLALLGDASMTRADPSAALGYYRTYLANRKAQSEAEPGNAETRRDVARGHFLVGSALLAADDLDGSAASLRTCLEIDEALEREDPGSVQKCGAVVEICQMLADVSARAGRFDEAATWLERGLSGLRKGVDRGLGNPALVASIKSSLEVALAVVRATDRALADRAFADAQSPAVARPLRFFRALTLARRRQHAEAARDAEALRAGAARDAESLYQIGRIYAVCARAASHEGRRGAGGPSPDAERLSRAYADRALEALRDSSRLVPLTSRPFTPDLDPLRGRRDFRQLFRPDRRSREADTLEPMSERSRRLKAGASV